MNKKKERRLSFSTKRAGKDKRAKKRRRIGNELSSEGDE